MARPRVAHNRGAQGISIAFETREILDRVAPLLETEHAGILVDRIAGALDRLVTDKSVANARLCLVLELKREEV